MRIFMNIIYEKLKKKRRRAPMSFYRKKFSGRILSWVVFLISVLLLSTIYFAQLDNFPTIVGVYSIG